jgi:NAD(P)-dependent dehydrogenase (short-subunit alcohol dehydrogenase family)
MSTQWGEQTTTDEVMRGIDLRGKTVVITGTSAGLGVEATRVLARAGARVIMAARDAQKNAAAMAAIRAQVPDAQLQHVSLDLSDLASVRRAGEQIAAAHPRIDILINNAGIMACPLARTAEGCELQFGTNHIGHFLFTCLLVPALIAAAPARIVNLSSAGHAAAGVDFDDPHFERRPYDNWVAYGQAKTANILFAVGLSKRLRQFGVTANAVHPGAIMTELGRHLTATDLDVMRAAWAESGPITFKTVEQGAATEVWAAVSPALADVSGRYLEDCHIAEEAVGPRSLTGYRAYAVDADNAERLWQLSEQIVGRHFDFGRAG